MSQIPKTQKAVFLEKFGTTPIVKQVEVPEIKENQLLIKVEAAPINPSDQSFLMGRYQTHKQAPCVPGFEGSGVVVDGKGDLAKSFIGKKVGFHATTNFGSYAQYSVTDIKNIVPMAEGVSFDIGSSSMINPLTVALMFDNAKKAGMKAVVHTAGASQVGRQMIRYFQQNGIEVLNIVRRQEQVELLTKLGAKHVLNQSDSDFWAKFKELAAKLEAKYAFDAIGGEFTSNLIDNLPKGSHVFVYGVLSGDIFPKVNVGDLLFNDKHLSGFWMSTEIAKRSAQEMMVVGGTVSQNMNTTFAPDINKSYTFEQFNEANQEYSKNMSAGKALIKFQL